jgi:hypothetical protein
VFVTPHTALLPIIVADRDFVPVVSSQTAVARVPSLESATWPFVPTEDNVNDAPQLAEFPEIVAKRHLMKGFSSQTTMALVPSLETATCARYAPDTDKSVGVLQLAELPEIMADAV